MRRLAVMSACFALLATIVPTTAASSADPSAALAGLTTLSGSGTVVTTLNVATAVEVDAGSLTLSLSPGATYGFVGFARQGCEPTSQFPRDVCMQLQAYLFPELGRDLIVLASQPISLPAGRYNVYLVSDGSIEFSMRTDDAQGQSAITATNPARAWLEELSPTCSSANCNSFVYGGRMRTVAGPAFAAGISFASTSASATPLSSVSATSCVYPNKFDGVADSSPQPSDHPTGCDFHPSSNSTEGASRTANFIVRSAGLLTENVEIRTNPAADGDTYIGFAGRQNAPLGEGIVAGYGLWIEDQTS